MEKLYVNDKILIKPGKKDEIWDRKICLSINFYSNDDLVVDSIAC